MSIGISVGFDGAMMTFRRVITRGSTVEASFNRGRQRGADTDERRASSDSKFYINNRLSRHKDVVQYAERFGIQVENLVQFLPQDRVDDFTKMTPSQVLESTELAVGGSELVQQHHELKERRARLNAGQSDVETKARELSTLKDQNKPLEAQIAADQQRLDLEKDLNNQRNIQLAQNYQARKADLNAAKDHAREVTEALTEVDDQLKPLERKLEQNSRKLTKLAEADFSRLKQTVQDHLKSKHEAMKKFGNATNIAEACRQKVYEAIDNLKRNRAEIPHLREQLAAKKRILQTKRPTADAEQELQQIKMEHRAAEEVKVKSEQKARTLQSEVHRLEQIDATLQNRLKQLQGVQQRRLEKLRETDGHTFNAAMWLNNNRNSMENEVYGPIQTLLNPSNRLAARILEALVPSRDLRAFLTLSPNDQRKLAALSKNPTNYKINVNYSSDIPQSISPMDITNLRPYGVDTVLSEMFDAPQVLKNYLCKTYGLHMIPVATRRGAQINTEAIFETNKQIRTICSDEFVYSVQNMRLGQSGRIYSDSGLGDNVRYLGDSIDPKQIEACKQEMENVGKQLSDVKAQLQNVSAQVQREAQTAASIKDRGHRIISDIKEHRHCEVEVERCKRALRNAMDQTIDFNRLINESQRELDQKVAKQMQYFDEMEKAARIVSDTIRKGCEIAIEIRCLESGIEKLSNDVDELRNIRNDRFRAKREADAAVQEAHNAALNLKNQFQTAMASLQEQGIDITTQTDPEAVQHRINELINQIDGLQAPMDRRQRAIYDERCRRIAQLEADVQDGELNTETFRQTLEQDGQNWRNRMQELAQGLTRYFSESMQSFGVGCSGAVNFIPPPDVSDYGRFV